MKYGELLGVFLLAAFVSTARFPARSAAYTPVNKQIDLKPVAKHTDPYGVHTPVPLVTPKNEAENQTFEEQGDRGGKYNNTYPEAQVPQPGLGPYGQISRATSEDLRTEEGKETVQPLQANTNALQEGQFAPQTSNVPGTFGESTNPTSNLYGAHGIPIFPGDFFSAKTGNPG